MPTYTFAARLILNPIRLQREEKEKEAERVHSNFEHHINPLRDLDDTMLVHALVKTPRTMTAAQSKAFETAFNHCLHRFSSAFECELANEEAKEATAKGLAETP